MTDRTTSRIFNLIAGAAYRYQRNLMVVFAVLLFTTTAWSHQLTAGEAAEYTADNIFSGHLDTTQGDTKWYRRQLP